MTVLEILALAGAGVVAGWMNVMAGGGSMLSVPALLFIGLPAPVANGTNRVAILAQNSVAALTYLRHGFREWRLSLSLTLAAIPGAIAGATLGAQLTGEWFDRVLALTMFVILVWMLIPHGSKKSEDPAPPITRSRLWLGHALMLLAGAWGGFIQIGVGFILMPILHRVIGLNLVVANQHKVFIVLGYTIIALMVFARLADIEWAAGFALAAGMALGGWLGAKTTLAKGESWIRFVFIAIIVVLILKLLLT